MNYMKTKIACAFIVSYLAVCVIIAVGTWESDGCVLLRPTEISSGQIYTERGGGLFGSSKLEVYYLWYKGKFENSGDNCIQRIRVTEKEYERRIYERNR